MTENQGHYVQLCRWYQHINQTSHPLITSVLILQISCVVDVVVAIIAV